MNLNVGRVKNLRFRKYAHPGEVFMPPHDAWVLEMEDVSGQKIKIEGCFQAPRSALSGEMELGTSEASFLDLVLGVNRGIMIRSEEKVVE